MQCYSLAAVQHSPRRSQAVQESVRPYAGCPWNVKYAQRHVPPSPGRMNRVHATTATRADVDRPGANGGRLPVACHR